MILDIWRKKTLAAMTHFAKELNGHTVMGMFKLLYFLDFHALKNYGAPVTQLHYKAMDRGPVPADLYAEIGGKDRATVPEDFREFLALQPIEGKHDLLLGNRWVALKAPEYKWLSKREITSLQDVASIYGELSANEISDVSHHRRDPWFATYKNGEGRNKVIKFELGLREVSAVEKERALEGLNNRHEAIRAFGLTRIK